MALTITNAHPQYPALSLGNVKARAVKVTFDSSYPTGGESFTPADLGLSEFIQLQITPRGEGANKGTVAQFDYTNKKILLFVEEAVAAGGPLVEAANASDQSSVVVDVLVLGA